MSKRVSIGSLTCTGTSRAWNQTFWKQLQTIYTLLDNLMCTVKNKCNFINVLGLTEMKQLSARQSQSSNFQYFWPRLSKQIGPLGNKITKSVIILSTFWINISVMIPDSVGLTLAAACNSYYFCANAFQGDKCREHSFKLSSPLFHPFEENPTPKFSLNLVRPSSFVEDPFRADELVVRVHLAELYNLFGVH